MKQIKRIKAAVLTLHDRAWRLKHATLRFSANHLSTQTKQKAEGKQTKLTLLPLLRDLVVEAVDVVAVILGLVRAQGRARQAKRAQHVPETPQVAHDTGGKVLLLLRLLLAVVDVSARASGEGRQLCLWATRASRPCSAVATGYWGL